MKIIYLRHTLSVLGGLERIFIDKINYLAQQPDHKIYILTYEQGDYPFAYPVASNVTHTDLGFPFYKLYQYGSLKRITKHWKMKKEFHRAFNEKINEIKPDIIICATCDYMSMEAMATIKYPVKKIIESHITKRGVEKTHKKGAGFLDKIKNRIMDSQMYKNIKKSDVLVSLTKKDAEDWSVVKPAIVIPNMLTYYPPTIDMPKVEKKRVISAGRLTEQKGFDLLINAWETVNKAHPDWVLDIYGRGEDREYLQKIIESCKLSQSVTLQEPTNKIYDKYMESDFYVMSSRWEGFGLVLAEAMSCGIPCVSFDCPHGPSDIIEDNEDGLLVKNGNIKQLAEKICFLIEHEDIRMKMGREARENIKRYLPESIMPQWEKLFKSLTQ